jgi:post-segregation antitoxin (ccd killing protein)
MSPVPDSSPEEITIIALPVSLYEALCTEAKNRSLNIAELLSKSLAEYLVNHPIEAKK